MAVDQQLNLIREGDHSWNAWRLRNPFEKPDLRGENLSEFNFANYNLDDADFRNGILRGTSFIGASLNGAHFAGADVSKANFRSALLRNVDFSQANLSRANFFKASLVGANLSGANLFATILRQARMRDTILADIDLETATGLGEVTHEGPSSMSVDTIYRSSGRISPEFLRGVGLPQILVDYIPSLVEADTGIRFNSCFLSYSHQDEVFATQLYGRMRQERIRVWYAPEEMKGGRKLFDQIERAIHMHDKLLVVLSPHSMQSNWVQTEIRKARKQEQQDRKRKLFPIRLVNIETIREWECFDADSGRDMAAELREYFIPDFSNWRDDKSFEKAFNGLIRDLRNSDGTPMSGLRRQRPSRPKR